MGKKIMRRYFVLFYLTLLAFCPSFCFSGLDSETLYLTWINNPDTTMVVQWLSLSNQSQQNDKIEYRLPNEPTWHLAVGEHRILPHSNRYILHRVELTQLMPDTLYQFKQADTDRIYSFQTMPTELTRPIRFVEGGDMYHDATTEYMKVTCKKAASTHPDFALLGGDIAYAVTHLRSKEKMERWIEWLQTWSSTMVTDEGRMIPVIAAIGNHDVLGQYNQTPAEAVVFRAIFPKIDDKVYGVLDFGKYLSLFILDSGHATPVDGIQKKWLKSALKEREGTPHMFAAYHVPAYPSFRSYNHENCKSVRNNWVPVFEKGGIRLAFEHHDHAYKRTKSLLKNKPNAEGITYLGDGAWSVGKPRSPLFVKKGANHLAKFVSSRHFLLVTIFPDGQELVLSISDTGKILDEYRSIPQPSIPVVIK